MVYVFGFLAVLLLEQIHIIFIFLRNSSKSKSDKIEQKKYSSDALKHSGNAICAVESGEIKKQLIGNDAPIYDSYYAMRQYENFVNKALIYKRILSVEGNRYNG